MSVSALENFKHTFLSSKFKFGDRLRYLIEVLILIRVLFMTMFVFDSLTNMTVDKKRRASACYICLGM